MKRKIIQVKMKIHRIHRKAKIQIKTIKQRKKERKVTKEIKKEIRLRLRHALRAHTHSIMRVREGKFFFWVGRNKKASP